MLIHNDVANAFGGVDNTGAIISGLTEANNPPPVSNLSATVTADRKLPGSSSRSVTPPSKTATCIGGALQRGVFRSLIDRGFIDTGFVETY